VGGASKVRICEAHVFDDNMSAQPTLSSEQIGPSDINNSLHSSRFSFYLAQSLVVGLQHPDDKRKPASSYQADQNAVLAQEFRAQQMFVQSKHYPGQLNVPRKTSSEYNREVGVLKDNFEAKKALIDKMNKMFHEMIDLSEEHAFMCEVQGWNNAKAVEASRYAFFNRSYGLADVNVAVKLLIPK
jgi:hypothetical protein